MSGSDSSQKRTLGDRLYEAAPGKDETVEELRRSFLRGSDAIEGIRFPDTCSPLSTPHDSSEDSSPAAE